MTQRIATILAVAVLAAACNGNRSQPAQTPGPEGVIFELVGTRWALMRLGEREITIAENAREPYIVLSSVERGVVGHGGCNRISSTFQSTGHKLSFGEVISTRMFCEDMPTESALLEVLKATAGWRISGSQLQLLGSNQQPLATFEARNL